MIRLTRDERDKFVRWCQEQAESNKGLEGPLTQLGGSGAEMLLKKNRAEAMACTVVAQLLLAWENYSIRKED